MNQLSAFLKKICAYLLLLFVTVASGCSSNTKPAPTSEAYNEVVSDFYLSLAAMQADQALFAIEKMQSVADEYPKEAAAWANLGLYAMRQADLELAAQRVDKALNLAPENSHIQFLAGNIASRRGNVEQAIDHYRNAVQADSAYMKALYALANELEREGDANNNEVYELYEQILEHDSGNLAVLLEMMRVSAKWQDTEALNESIKRLSRALKVGLKKCNNSLLNWKDKSARGMI
ncbi:MAG: hypothetical protein U5J95_03510 [Balneolaceae bacterium]|nr:hypothetical protein [Balneolaceae bacterium]